MNYPRKDALRGLLSKRFVSHLTVGVQQADFVRDRFQSNDVWRCRISPERLNCAQFKILAIVIPPAPGLVRITRNGICFECPIAQLERWSERFELGVFSENEELTLSVPQDSYVYGAPFPKASFLIAAGNYD